MHVPAFLLLCVAVIVPVAQCVGEDDDLADRQTRLETLLAAQDERLNTVERENQQLKLSNLELKNYVVNLQVENQELRDGLTTLSQKVAHLHVSPPTPSRNKPDGQGDTFRDVVARADDPNPLEEVVAQMGQQLTAVEADVQMLQNTVQQASSSVFTRWGHSACPASNQLIYSGVVGGSFWSHSGAAANYLCLTLSPVPGNHGDPGAHALLFGAEYETLDSHHERDPVCAVCRSPRPNIIMIPGTNRCESGWTLEYSGYLMAGRHSNTAATEYVCVDSTMQSRDGSNENRNGVLFYYTFAQCGSLPCEPYVNDKMVTCAVCSQ